MIIKETNIGNQRELTEILSSLSAMRLRGEVKLIRGSFDLNSIIDTEFRVKDTGERWILYCVNEAPSGSGYLKRG